MIKEITQEIKDWLADFRMTTPSNVMEDDDDGTFGGSSAQIMGRMLDVIGRAQALIVEADEMLQGREDEYAEKWRAKVDELMGYDDDQK